MSLDALRRESSIGLIMLDLDRFKKLNDTHGHGAGDTVLREVAAAKAEQIRHKIAGLTFVGGMSVTASFGVAAVPETSTTAATLLNDADTALYKAKTGGRDRVIAAPGRGPAARAEADIRTEEPRRLEAA